MANPVPCGVAGFALTTFALGLFTSGQIRATNLALVLGLAAFYGGLTQFIAGWFAVARGDLFPAVFMTTYGAFWFSFVALFLFVPRRFVLGVPGAGTVGGLAFDQAAVVFLIMWSVITFIFTLATLGTNWTVFWTFIVFDCALVIETIGFWRGSAQIQHIGGYFEMVLAAMAWYIVMAEVVNESVDHPVFPLFPFKKPWFKPVSPPVHYPEHVGGTAGA